MKIKRAWVARLSVIFVMLFCYNIGYSEDCSSILKQSYNEVKKIKDYKALVETYNRKGNVEDYRVYDYRYLSPGYIRMKVVEGSKKGSEVFYDPSKNVVKGCRKIVVRICKEFNPEDSEVRSIRGVRIYETSMANILEGVGKYLSKSSCSVKEEGTFYVLNLSLKERDGDVDRILLRIGRNNYLPQALEKYGNGVLLYKLTIGNFKKNVNLKFEDMVL
ncbi:MAG: hypothetical protein ACPLSJ_02370 [Thermosulfidibacteraceae bacterium]|jgi:outer membrane lipoprotein-sorting protein